LESIVAMILQYNLIELSMLQIITRPWLRSKTHYKCFEAFPIRRKNFTSWPIKKCFKAFAASR